MHVYVCIIESIRISTSIPLFTIFLCSPPLLLLTSSSPPLLGSSLSSSGAPPPHGLPSPHPPSLFLSLSSFSVFLSLYLSLSLSLSDTCAHACTHTHTHTHRLESLLLGRPSAIAAPGSGGAAVRRSSWSAGAIMPPSSAHADGACGARARVMSVHGLPVVSPFPAYG
jgi:hypothetical protein